MLYPRIASEWHPTKNGKLKPENIVAVSHTKVWWKCTKGNDHEWQSSVKNRTTTHKKPNTCPKCREN